MSEQTVIPQVNAKAEFAEIVNDFSSPFEIFREAISNAFDHGASEMHISIEVAEIGGYPRVVITLTDNGTGMTHEVLNKDFWGLGFSQSRGKESAIGNKGHGTKIYLRSQKVEVRTQTATEAHFSVCLEPYAALSKGELHSPTIVKIDKYQTSTGSTIRVEGYNDNERSKYYFDVVKDYILWHTKIGSVENEFGIAKHAAFKLWLKCLDTDGQFRLVPFGHVFAKESLDLEKLWEQHGTEAPAYYAKRYLWPNLRLKKFPEVTYDVVIYVEGDEAKRQYNSMIRRKNRSDTGRYTVGSMYGIWLCRDFIPVERKNEWISGFGSGSNAYVLLHGFINCQKFKLTANRGAVSNSNPEILSELRSEVSELIAKIDSDLRTGELYTLLSWQDEEKTEKQEKDDFTTRVKNIRVREFYTIDGRKLLAPQSESELYAFLITLYCLRPDNFDFEPLDYNTNRGIDIVVRNKSSDGVTVPEFGYIELKKVLAGAMNHTFGHISRIVCWDFPKELVAGAEFSDLTQKGTRKIRFEEDDDGVPVYYLDAPKKTKIEVIRLREFIERKLSLSPSTPKA